MTIYNSYKKLLPENTDISMLLSVESIDFKSITDRINSLHFMTKNELIYFCLTVFKKYLDEEDTLHYSKTKKVEFQFEFFTKKDRILVYSNNKIMSVYLPFRIYEDGGNRFIKSKLEPFDPINLDEILFLQQYFRNSLFLEYEKYSLIDQEGFIEEIKQNFVESVEGFRNISIERMSKLISELSFYDSSYVRYDIDFENSIKHNESNILNENRVYAHPPYHIDSDYRQSSSYKIGFDKKLSKEEFRALFQADNEPAMLIHSGYKPGSLLNEVKAFISKLD